MAIFWFFAGLRGLILIPIIMGSFKFNSFDKGMKIFYCSLLLIFANDIMKLWMAVTYHNNLMVSHFYTPLFLTIISLFFYNRLEDHRRLITFVAPVILGFCILFGSMFFNEYASMSQLFTSVYVAYLSFQLLNKQKTRNADFYIAGGLFLFYTVSLMHFTLFDYLYETNKTNALTSAIILEIIIFLTNIDYTLAIWKYPKSSSLQMR